MTKFHCVYLKYNREKIIYMYKRIITLLLLIISLYTFHINVNANQENKSKEDYVVLVYDDNRVMSADYIPRIRNGSTYVSLESIAEFLDITITNYADDTVINLDKDGEYLSILPDRKILKTSTGISLPLEMTVSEGLIQIPVKPILNYFAYNCSYIAKDNLLVPMIRIKKEGKVEDKDIYTRLHRDIDTEFYRIKMLSVLPRVATEKKVIFITFDDGPNLNTTGILDNLDKYDMKATFFMLGNSMNSHKDTVERMQDSGHGLGLHGITHNRYKVYKNAESVVNEMDLACTYLQNITHYKTNVIRVPYGSKPYLTQAQYDNILKKHYMLWDWNIDSYDSRKGATPKKIYNETISQLKKLSHNKKKIPVILFHDTNNTLQALPDILKYIHSHDYIALPLTNDIPPINWWNKS